VTLPVVRTARGLALRDHPGSIVEVLDTALTRWPDSVLLIDPALDRTVTYRQFADLVEGAAAAFAPGVRVATMLHNGLEAAVAIWACARAGAIHVGIPVESPPARVQGILELVDAGRLLTHGAPELNALPLPWQARPHPDPAGTYCLIPTSGTTGRPKAVRVTGTMTGHAVAYYIDALGLGPGDRTAIHLPFSWVSGHVTQLAPVMASGGSAVTMAAYTAPALIDVVAAYGVTWLDVVPSIWEGLLRCADLERLHRVRLAVYGGAPAPTDTLERVRERLPGLALHDVYALSETCAPVTHLPDGEPLGTVGRPVPYVEVRLSADGEIEVRSAVVTPGYWGDEPLRLSDDGWFQTGDLGSFVDGRLRTEGRAVDLIMRGGVNVYPQEVERALLSTGLLADAVAYGVPSSIGGQAVAAAVVPKPGVDVDVALLRRVVQETVGVHAVPRPLRVLAELPRNANGKVDRGALAAH
jgi:acyl-CoA synthetase (AMP-forming)/AMP-acid ligase II